MPDSGPRVVQLIGAEYVPADAGKRSRGKIAAVIVVTLLVLIAAALFVLFKDGETPRLGEPEEKGGYEFGDRKPGTIALPAPAPAPATAAAPASEPPAVAAPASAAPADVTVAPATSTPAAPALAPPVAPKLPAVEPAPALIKPPRPVVEAAQKAPPEAAAPIAAAPKRGARTDGQDKAAASARSVAPRSANGRAASKPCTDTVAALGLCERKTSAENN